MELKALLKTSSVFAAPWTIGAVGSGGGLYALFSENENHSKQNINVDLEKLTEARRIKSELEKEKSELDQEIDALKKSSEETKSNIGGWNDSIIFIKEQTNQLNEEATEILTKLNSHSKQISSWAEEAEETKLKEEINKYSQSIENHQSQISGYLQSLSSASDISDAALNNKESIKTQILQKITELKNKEKEILERISKIGSIATNIQSQITKNKGTKSSHETRKNQLADQKQNIEKGSILTDQTTNDNTNYQVAGIADLEGQFVRSRREIQEQINDFYSLYSSVLNTKYRKLNFSSIQLNKITVSKKEGAEPTFSTKSSDGKNIEFQVQKHNELLKVGEFSKKSKENGFNHWNIWKQRLNDWNKKFTLKVVDFHNNSEFQIQEEEISLNDIFNTSNNSTENILVYSTKILLSLEAIKSKYLEKNSEGKFEMKKTPTIPSGHQVKRNDWYKNRQQTWTLEVYGFASKDDFIKYWIQKTLELLTTGKADFTDILDPFYQKDSYST